MNPTVTDMDILMALWFVWTAISLGTTSAGCEHCKSNGIERQRGITGKSGVCSDCTTAAASDAVCDLINRTRGVAVAPRAVAR